MPTMPHDLSSRRCRQAPAARGHVFEDRLKVSLTLQLGARTLALPAGAIKHLRFDVTRIGFSADVGWIVSSEQVADPLLDAFVTHDVITAVLRVEAKEPAPNAAARDALVLTGVVTDKTMVETHSESIEGEPVILRRYAIRFLDPAQAYWRRHYPSELYAAATLKSVLELHKCGGLSLEYDWPFLMEERQVIALGLGRDDARASFYDFVLWLVDRHGGVFELDTSTNTYRFGAKKSVDATTRTLLSGDVHDLDVDLRPPLRSEQHVLNAFAPTPTKEKLEVKSTVVGVRRDNLRYTPIASRFAAEKGLIGTSLRPTDHRVRVVFAQYPRNTHRPGKTVLLDESFSPNLFTAKKKYRVVTLHVTADAPLNHDEVPELDDEDAIYTMDAFSLLEPRADPGLDLPPYVPPKYPFHVEGKVMSDGGQATDRTWTTIEDAKSSLYYHRVEVPLFNKKVLVPYQAGYLPGQLFFPAYKNQRVLLALHFDEARVERFLDWAENARMPQDKQGQAIAFGKKAKDGTLLSHVYADAKPVLTLKRVLDSDEQTLTMKEGTVTFDVRQTSMAPVVEPTYDVTPNVAAAQSKLETQVKGSIGEVTTTFSGATSKVADTLTQTTEEVESKLSAVETELSVRAALIRSEVEGMISALSDSVSDVATAISEAKAAIMQAALS